MTSPTPILNHMKSQPPRSLSVPASLFPCRPLRAHTVTRRSKSRDESVLRATSRTSRRMIEGVPRGQSRPAVTRNALILGGAAVLLAFGVAGCTPSSSHSSAPDASTPVRGSSAVTTTPPTGESCELSETSTLTTQDEVTVIVELTDAGGGSCELQGTPQVTFLDAEGTQAAIAVQASSGEQFPGTPVEVDPGGHAYLTFLLDTTGSCVPTGAATMLIAVSGAPNTTRVELGSTTFCPTADDVPPLSYPVTPQPTTLT
ncbi:hypothetical protein C5D08_15295 [Rathayibacter sp. AY1B6]|nr:hypothetical protein C5D08_15295 [Rathayibacter sp. AY1B6]